MGGRGLFLGKTGSHVSKLQQHTSVPAIAEVSHSIQEARRGLDWDKWEGLVEGAPARHWPLMSGKPIPHCRPQDNLFWT